MHWASIVPMHWASIVPLDCMQMNA